MVVGMVCSMVKGDNASKRGQELEFVVERKCKGFNYAAPQFQPCHRLSLNSPFIHFYF